MSDATAGNQDVRFFLCMTLNEWISEISLETAGLIVVVETKRDGTIANLIEKVKTLRLRLRLAHVSSQGHVLRIIRNKRDTCGTGPAGN